MSVRYITGNLLDYPSGISVIAHCCNRQGVMGAGIARQLRDEMPAACEPYFAAFEDGKKPPLGSVIAGEAASGRRVLHYIAQEDIGTEKRQVDYEGLLRCLEQTRDILENAHREGRIWILGLPWLGCGLAGGNRIIVRALIEATFGESPVECVVADLPSTQQTAGEPAS